MVPVLPTALTITLLFSCIIFYNMHWIILSISFELQYFFLIKLCPKLVQDSIELFINLTSEAVSFCLCVTLGQTGSPFICRILINSLSSSVEGIPEYLLKDSSLKKQSMPFIGFLLLK